MTSYWRNRRVLCTGGTGFLGRHLTALLQQLGARVTSTGSERNLTNPFAARALIREHADATHIFHLAASVGGIGFNVANPFNLGMRNLLIGANLLDALSHSSFRGNLIVPGTVCSYPANTSIPFDENNLFNGYPEPSNATYGIAKRALLPLLQAAQRAWGLRSVYLLLANLYGPGDCFDPARSHVIPGIITRIEAAQQAGKDSVVLWGSGQPTRDFLYVTDAVDALLLAAELYDKPTPINIGTGNETRIRDLASIIAGMMGYDGTIAWDDRKPDGQARRVLNVARAAGVLGWHASMSLEAGLEMILAGRQHED